MDELESHSLNNNNSLIKKIGLSMPSLEELFIRLEDKKNEFENNSKENYNNITEETQENKEENITEQTQENKEESQEVTAK